MSSKVHTKLQQTIKEGFIPEPTFQLATQIEARLAHIMSTTGAVLRGVDWNQWRHINFHVNYFANRFPFDVKGAENKHWNITINQVLRYGFLFGSSGIWKSPTGKIEVISVQNYEGNKAEIVILNKDYKRVTLDGSKSIKVPVEDVVEYRFDYLALPAIVTLNPVLKFESNITKGYLSSTIINSPRIGLKHNNNVNSEENIRNFVNLDNVAMIIPEGGSDQILAYNLATDIQGFNELAQQGQKWYYDMIGRRTNTSFKKEHVGEYEELNASSNVAAQEFERYLYVKNFLSKLSKLFNLTIYLENLNGKMEDCNNDIVTEIEDQVEHKEKTDNEKTKKI